MFSVEKNAKMTKIQTCSPGDVEITLKFKN